MSGGRFINIVLACLLVIAVVGNTAVAAPVNPVNTVYAPAVLNNRTGAIETSGEESNCMAYPETIKTGAGLKAVEGLLSNGTGAAGADEFVGKQAGTVVTSGVSGNKMAPELVEVSTAAGMGATNHTDLAAILAKLSGDPATQTTLAAILAKLTADPATQTTSAAILAKLTADPATQTTLAAILTKLADPATQTTLAAVLAKLSSDPATQTTLAAMSAKLPATLGPKQSDDSMSVVLAGDSPAGMLPDRRYFMAGVGFRDGNPAGSDIYQSSYGGAGEPAFLDTDWAIRDLLVHPVNIPMVPPGVGGYGVAGTIYKGISVNIVNGLDKGVTVCVRQFGDTGPIIAQFVLPSTYSIVISSAGAGGVGVVAGADPSPNNAYFSIPAMANVPVVALTFQTSGGVAPAAGSLSIDVLRLP